MKKLILCALSAVQAESGKLCVLLDYTVKQYRDYAVGYHLFGALKEEGFSRFEFRQKANNHAKYLNKMGFKNVGGVFIKEV